MCGIFGVFPGPRTRSHLQSLDRFDRLLRHRGPDDFGFLYLGDHRMEIGRSPELPSWARAAFLHRRLAIIDLDGRAAQPMRAEDDSVVLLYNGEIYNFPELKRDLADAGYQFRTTSDTEALLAGYRVWGPDVVTRLNGMFAFILIDRGRRTVMLARDPFGIKPLYLLNHGDTVAVCSELPPLIDLLGTNADLDSDTAMFLISTQGRPLAEGQHTTLIRGIEEVPPGSMAVLKLDDLLPAEHRADRPGRPVTVSWTPYFSLPLERDEDMTLAAAVERLRTGFLASVRRHLVSDQPVTTTLSGGVDSSAMIRCIRHILGADAPVTAYGYVCREAETLNEQTYMRAAALGTARLKEVTVDASSLVRSLDAFLDTQTEPVTGLSAFAQYSVYQAIAEDGFKVVLDGQGADEILCGYSSYVLVRVAELARAGLWHEVQDIYRHDDFGRAGTVPGLAERIAIEIAVARREGHGHLPAALLRCSDLTDLVGHVRSWPLEGPWPSRSATGAPDAPARVGPWDLLDRGTRDHLEALARDGGSAGQPLPPVTQKANRFIHALMYPQFRRMLRFQDRNAMALSLENRVPFLDRDFVRTAFTVPVRHLIDRTGLTKAAFRTAFRDLVPATILERRRKIGFEVPLTAWMPALQSRLAVLSEPGGLGDAPFLKPGALASAFGKFLAGAADAPDPDFLLYLFSLDRLIRRYGLRV